MFRTLLTAGRCVLASALALCVFAPVASAKKVKPEQVLYSFCPETGNCNDGSTPMAGLIMDASGNLYGTTTGGGGAGDCNRYTCGTVFRVAPDGTETVLHNFCSEANCSDGKAPQAGVIMDGTGNLYGTTEFGGVEGTNCNAGCGVVYKLAPDGTETVLYGFCSQPNCTDGAYPLAGLMMDSSGNLYGTTKWGGSAGPDCNNNYGCGAVFRIAPDGTETVLYSFCSAASCADGEQPVAGLTMDNSGNLYGTTLWGGESADSATGTVFKLAPDGSETVLYAFCLQLRGCVDGSQPNSNVIEDAGGNLYGTTATGGAFDLGTVFRIASDGTETLLHSFDYTIDGDGNAPVGGVIADSVGNLYGATLFGGNTKCKRHSGCGTVFKLGTDGTETLLYTFKSKKGGVYPAGGLIADPQGNLYGTTTEGGTSNNGGVVFKINNAETRTR